MDIFEVVKILYPQLILGEDWYYQDDGDGNGPYLAKWPDDLSFPTEAQIAQLTAEKQLAESIDKLNTLTRQANAQVSALQGRVTTLDYLINEQDPDDEDYEAPTPADEAELVQRKAQLKSWNSYNVKLGRVKTTAGWPATPAWPVMPEPYTTETSAVSSPTE